jgi:UDP:flavonoid glycosyltransferase YjiC (YdhE family)
MRILISTFGSIGEVMPFVAIADALRARGHRPLFICNANYAALIQAQGFDHVAAWDRPASMSDLDVLLRQDPQAAWNVVHREMLEAAEEPTYRAIAHYADQERCILLASGTALGAIRAHRTLDVPLCLAYLSPHAIELGQAHGLDTGRSNLRLAAFFPRWFAIPGRNWPAELAYPGFPFPDDALIPALPDKLEEFLRHGPSPIIFTPGSFMRNARVFFEEAMKACQETKWRAIFLTPYAENIPSSLPDSICHYQYIALQRLAPRAAALVCHGGIGTIAQGMRAGIPQHLSPLFFDQFDNADQLHRLGVGDRLPAGNWNHRDVIGKLSALRQSPTVAQNCSDVRQRLQKEESLGRVCDLVESLS